MDMYFEGSLRETETRRRSANVVDRLILKLAYRDQLSARAYAEPFEIEHLMPVSLLQREVKKDGDRRGWPINSVANFAVLDKKTNREKSAKTIAEYVATKSSERKRLEQFVFLDVDSVVYPYEGDQSNSEGGWLGYTNFLRDNFGAMQEAVLRTLAS